MADKKVIVTIAPTGGMANKHPGRIGDTPTTSGNSGERSKPLSRVGVESVKIVPADSVK